MTDKPAPIPIPSLRPASHEATLATQQREINRLTLHIARQDGTIVGLHIRCARLEAENRRLRLRGPRWYETLLACLLTAAEGLWRSYDHEKGR